MGQPEVVPGGLLWLLCVLNRGLAAWSGPHAAWASGRRRACKSDSSSRLSSILVGPHATACSHAGICNVPLTGCGLQQQEVHTQLLIPADSPALPADGIGGSRGGRPCGG